MITFDEINAYVHYESSCSKYGMNLTPESYEILVVTDGDNSANAAIGNPPNIYDENWLKVRHLPARTEWHDATDRLKGSDEYG